MPVSRYDIPSVQNIQSQYVGIPLAELSASANRQQDRADKNMGAVSAASSALEKLPVISEHQSAKDTFVNRYRQDVTSLLDQGLDPATSEFKKQSSNLINKYLSDPNLNTFSRGVENKKMYMEDIAEKKKNNNYGAYNDPNAPLYQQYSQGQNPWIDAETGRAKEYNYNPIQASSDHTIPVYKLFDKIKPSGSEREWFDIDASNGSIIGYKKGYEGQAQNFINGVAANNVDTFLDTPEGQDFGRKLVSGGQIKDLGQLRSAAKDYMQDIGSAYVFGKGKEGTNYKYADKDVRAGLAQTNIDINAPTTHNEATDNPYKGNKISLNLDRVETNDAVYTKDNDGTIRKTTTNPFGGGGTTTVVPKAEGDKIFGETEAVSKATLDRVKENYKNIYGNEKDFKNLSDKEITDLYNNAVDNSGKFIPKDINFGTKKSDLITPQILGGKNTIANLSNLPIQLIGDKGGKNITYDQLKEELGVGADNAVQSAKVMGRFENHPDIPGAYKVVVTTKNGTTRTLAVGADDKTEQYFAPFQGVFQSNLSGQDANYKIGDVLYKTINAPRRDGKGFNTKVQIVSPAGTEEMSLDKFTKTVNGKYDERFASLYTAGYGTTSEEKLLATEEDSN